MVKIVGNRRRKAYLITEERISERRMLAAELDVRQSGERDAVHWYSV